jgi:hypothetical protein
MTTPTRLAAACLPALLCAALAAPGAQAAPQATGAQSAPAPDPAPMPDMRPQVIPAQALRMHYYTARHSDARELSSVLSQLAGRMFHVADQDGLASQPISNVRTFGNVVVLYDRPERIAELVKILAELEQANAEDPAQTESLMVAEYRPQYLSVQALYSALAPLRRSLHQQPARGSVPGAVTPNVTPLEQPAMIVMRDTPEQLEQMLALMRRLDVPPPQVQISCWLLTGAGGDAERTADLPEDLVRNLSRIVPEDAFRRLCVTMIRTSVLPGQAQKLRSDFRSAEFDERFELILEPAGFDPGAGVLPITRCRFEASTGQEFETSVTLRSGEYTVIGAAGIDPLYVVLQVTALDG